MNDELGFSSIAALADMIERGELSPVELIDALLSRVEVLEPKLNAFITVTAEQARAQAIAAEKEIAAGKRRGPLHGIPFGLKDIYDTAGIRTTAHSRIYEHRVPSADATTTARLYDAGAILLGKLATHEFAHGGPSFDLLWPPARNPWHLDHFTGGSSSGSASAVAAGLMPVALGSDTGGSIRGPAGLSGLVGLKPTYGLVSRRGIVANSYSYDHAGPLTRTVEDAAIVLQALAGHDPLDPASAVCEIPDYRAEMGRDIRGMKIGFVRHFHEADEPVSDEVHSALEQVVRVYRELGGTVEDVRMRPLRIYQDIKVTAAECEVLAIHQSDLQSRLEEYGEDFLGRVLPALLISAADYLHAQRERRAVLEEMEPIYAEFDALLTVGPGPAPTFAPWRVINFWKQGAITAPFNVTGGPSLVQRMGFTESGMPMSLQISGRPFDDAKILRIADAYERATGWHLRQPPLSAKTPPGGKLGPRPEPATSTLNQKERDEVALICERAGMKLNERMFEQLCASAPLIEAMTGRIRRERQWSEEPANVFRFRMP